MPYYYTAFGLSFASDVECPELTVMEPSSRADVTITLAEIPERIEAPLHVARRAQIGEGVFQFEPRGLARYRVVRGEAIQVQPLAGAAPEDVRLYLLGTALGILLHQRGLLPLHASVVEWDGGAVAFCGPSGAGKSTLAAALHSRGQSVLCDDVGVVVPGPDGDPLLYPGFPRIKLWRDALEHFDLDHRELTPDWTRAEKYHLQLHDTFHRRPLPLRQVHFLERAGAGEPAALHPLKGGTGVPLLVTNTYRAGQARRMGESRANFLRCAQVADKVALYRFVRPWGLEQLAESIALLAAAVPGKAG